MTTVDRLIDWCETRRLSIDVDFIKGTIKINGNKHKFKNQDEALAWATKFSENWGFAKP